MPSFLVRAVISASRRCGALSRSLAVASVSEAVREKSSSSLVASTRPLWRIEIFCSVFLWEEKEV